jgi:ADP-ribose pyrophosphatase
MTYEILKRVKHYQGHAFDVSKVYFKLPNGRERGYDLVEHGDSVSIVPVSEDGQIYFVTQHRIGAGKDLLELPAGVLDGHEDPIAAADRELQEEIGKSAKNIRLLGGFYLAPGYTDEYMSVFLATGLFDAALDPDEDEFIEVSNIPITEAYQKAISGQIDDGKTLAALMLAYPLLKKDFPGLI